MQPRITCCVQTAAALVSADSLMYVYPRLHPLQLLQREFNAQLHGVDAVTCLAGSAFQAAMEASMLWMSCSLSRESLSR